MIPEFTNPSFVNENDPDTIQNRMMQELPEDIDNMPGGFPWDFTRPTALEKAELVQFHLVETLKLMFPMWAIDEWLDRHGEMAGGLKRRQAGYASGRLTVTGVPETIIKAGTTFSTAATQERASIEYKAVKEAVIGEAGTVEAEIIAVEPGIDGNVAAHTITLLSKPRKEITKVTNEQAVTGGTEEESDDSLRERIQERNEAIGTSFTGCDADYVRWAKEVTGVGSAVVMPEWDGPGTVKLILTDGNGEPANDTIIANVYHHIIAPDNRLLRLAPIGAQLTVSAPEVMAISYEFNLYLKPGYNKVYIESQFRKNLLAYYEEAKNEGILRFTKICAVLSETEGVYDFSDLTINGLDHQNIKLEIDDYPRTDKITITVQGG